MPGHFNTAGKSTREMADQRRKQGITVGLIVLGILVVAYLLLTNSQQLGLGGGVLLVLLILLRIVPDWFDGYSRRQAKTVRRAERGAVAEEQVGELLAQLGDDFENQIDEKTAYARDFHESSFMALEIDRVDTDAYGKIELITTGITPAWWHDFDKSIPINENEVRYIPDSNQQKLFVKSSNRACILDISGPTNCFVLWNSDYIYQNQRFISIQQYSNNTEIKLDFPPGPAFLKLPFGSWEGLEKNVQSRQVVAIAFSYDRYIVLTKYRFPQEMEAEIFSKETNKKLISWKSKDITVQVTDDDRYAYLFMDFGFADQFQLMVYDLANMELVINKMIKGTNDGIPLFVISSDYRWIASAWNDKSTAISPSHNESGMTIKIFGFKDSDKETQIRIPFQGSTIEISPDSTMVVIGNDNGEASYVNLINGKVISTKQMHQEPISRVSFSPDQKTLITLGRSGILKFWEIMP